MITLEQVKLLESKVTWTIEYVRKVTKENGYLKEKLDSYQKRIDELEVHVKRFKEDQSRIEDGILSALDRLNQFEDAVESVLSTETAPGGGGAIPRPGKVPPAEDTQESLLTAESKLSGESKVSGGNKPSKESGVSVKDKHIPADSKKEEKPASTKMPAPIFEANANNDEKSSEELDIF